jgi:hypothetical protein
MWFGPPRPASRAARVGGDRSGGSRQVRRWLRTGV